MSVFGMNSLVVFSTQGVTNTGNFLRQASAQARANKSPKELVFGYVPFGARTCLPKVLFTQIELINQVRCA